MELFKEFTFFMRLQALVATTSALIIIATTPSDEYFETYALMFFVIVTSIGIMYGILALFLPYTSVGWCSLVLGLDLIVTLLLTSGVSAVLAVAEVERNSNDPKGWLPTCDQFPKYCDHVDGALLAGLIGMATYMVLVPLSIVIVIESFRPAVPGPLPV